MNSFSSKLKKLNLHPCFSRVDSRSVRHRHITPGTEGVTFNNVKCEWCHPPPFSFFRQMFCVEMIKVGGSDLVLIINNYYPDWNEMKDQLSSFPTRHHQPGSSIQHRTHVEQLDFSNFDIDVLNIHIIIIRFDDNLWQRVHQIMCQSINFREFILKNPPLVSLTWDTKLSRSRHKTLE